MRKIFFGLLIITVSIIVIVTFLLSSSCKAETAKEIETITETVVETVEVEKEAVEEIQLVLWSMASPGSAEMEWTEDASEAFDSENPNIDVIVEPQPGLEMNVIFQTASAAHRGADLVQLWSGLQTFVFDDMLVDLRTLGVTNEEIEEYYAPYCRYLNFDESKAIVSYPAGTTYCVGHIVYNKKMFRDSGITWEPTPENKFAMTWDEFFGACQKLKDNGYEPIGWGNEGGYMASWWWRPLIYQYLFPPDDDLKLWRNEIKYTDPNIVEAITKLQELSFAGFFIEGGNSIPWNDAFSLVANEEAAMRMGWHSGKTDTYVYDALGEDAGVMSFPVINPDSLGGNGVMIFEGADFHIPVWSKYPEESLELMRFMGSDEWQFKWYEYTNTIPIKILPKEKLKPVYPQEEQFFIWLETLRHIPDLATNVIPSEIFTEGFANGIPLLQGDITPEEFCERLQNRTEELDYEFLIFNQ